MKNNLKEQIYDRVEKWYKQRVGITRLQEMISKAIEQEIPMELIREIIAEIKEWKSVAVKNRKTIHEWTKELEKRDWWLKDMVKEVWDEKLYDYNAETDHIIFYPPNSKSHPILRTTVLAMFEKYSKDGENLSGKQMQQQFQLTPKVWLFIKSVMDLYKDSLPFDKVTLSQISWEDMDKIAANKAEQLTEAKMRRSYDKAVTGAKDSLLRKLYIQNEKQIDILDAISIATKRFKPIDFSTIKVPEINNNDTKRVIIADSHLGKIDTDGIVIRFKKLTRDLIETPEKKIDIKFLWDLWEQFVAWWEKHPWTKLWMENISLEDLFLLILDTFQQMLIDLYNAWKQVTFSWVWWNHDSFEANKDFDPLRSPAMIIYRLLEKNVKWTNIKINILREKLNIIQDWKFIFLIAHWDKVWINTVKWWALQYMKDGYYIIVLTADKHHSEILEISDRVSWIITPALAGKWKYDHDLWLSSLPWAIFIDDNKDWLPDITVKRYK